MSDEFKFADIRLGYINPVADYKSCLKRNDSHFNALNTHSNKIKNVADNLNKIAKIIDNYDRTSVKFIIEPQYGQIIIKGSAELINELVKNNFATIRYGYHDYKLGGGF